MYNSLTDYICPWKCKIPFSIAKQLVYLKQNQPVSTRCCISIILNIIQHVRWGHETWLLTVICPPFVSYVQHLEVPFTCHWPIFGSKTAGDVREAGQTLTYPCSTWNHQWNISPEEKQSYFWGNTTNKKSKKNWWKLVKQMMISESFVIVTPFFFFFFKKPQNLREVTNSVG